MYDNIINPLGNPLRTSALHHEGEQAALKTNLDPVLNHVCQQNWLMQQGKRLYQGQTPVKLIQAFICSQIRSIRCQAVVVNHVAQCCEIKWY